MARTDTTTTAPVTLTITIPLPGVLDDEVAQAISLIQYGSLFVSRDLEVPEVRGAEVISVVHTDGTSVATLRVPPAHPLGPAGMRWPLASASSRPSIETCRPNAVSGPDEDWGDDEESL